MLFRYRRLLLADVTALLLLCFLTFNSRAVQNQPASIAFDIVRIDSCDNDIIEGTMVLTVLDSNGNIVDVSGTSDLTITFFSLTSPSSAVANTFTVNASLLTSVSFGVSLPGVDVGNVEVVVRLTADPSVQSPILRIDCGTLSYDIIATQGSSDGRLNPNAGDLINVLYRGTDEAGNPAIDVYRVDGDKGVYLGQFEYVLFEPYIGAPPAVNRRLAAIDKATLYALTSGEFQVNVGPDAEGKYGIVIFSGLPPTATRRSILELR